MRKHGHGHCAIVRVALLRLLASIRFLAFCHSLAEPSRKDSRVKMTRLSSFDPLTDYRMHAIVQLLLLSRFIPEVLIGIGTICQAKNVSANEAMPAIKDMYLIQICFG